MREVIIIVLCVVFIVLGCPDYLSSPDCSTWIKAVSYHLYHANIFHLAANCLSVWFVFQVRPGRKVSKMLAQLFVAFIIASLTYCISPRPVVGISNILFAILGLRTPAFNHPWWKQPGTLVFFGITAAMLFFPQFAALTHIASFILGTCVAAAVRSIRSLNHDLNKATGR